MCPLCGTKDKDVHHMLTCCHISASKKWTESLREFKTHLENFETNPKIIPKIIKQLRHWRRNPSGTPLEPLIINNWEVCHYIQHQNHIGWENFLRGRCSLLWEQNQQLYLESIQSKCTGNTWMRKVIKSCWKIMWDLQDVQNHGKHHTITPAFWEEIQKLHKNITEQYELGGSDLLTSDSHLLDDPLEELLDHDLDYQKRWLGTIHVAGAKFNHLQWPCLHWHIMPCNNGFNCDETLITFYIIHFTYIHIYGTYYIH